MNERFKNAWEYVKEHKVQFGIAAAATVAAVSGIVLLKLPKPTPSGKTFNITIPKVEKKVLPDLGIGVLEDVTDYGDKGLELWMDKIPLTKLGDLGDAIRDNFEGVSDDSEVWALLNVRPISEC